MLLAIDAGNTNIVFAVYDGQQQLDQCRMETHGKIPESIHEIVRSYPDIKEVIVSSVVPKVNEAIEKSCDYLLKIDPVFVTYENAGIEIAIDNPEQIGADRLVDAAAVLAHYQAPAVIVDFGTATTFDVIDVQGRYGGGVIAPGVNLSLRALEQAAAKLPEVGVERPGQIIGKNTKDAMQSGIYWGYVSLIEGIVQRMSDEMKVKPYVIATGGLATLFSQGTDIFDAVDSDLIMKGLVHINAQISQKNDNRKTA